MKRKEVFLVVVLSLVGDVSMRAYGSNDIASDCKRTVEEEFERLCVVTKNHNSLSSIPSQIIENVSGYQEMIDLGVPCLPYLMKKLDDESNGDEILMFVAARIIKCKPDELVMTGHSYKKWLDEKLETGAQDAASDFRQLVERWERERLYPELVGQELWIDIVELDHEHMVYRTRRVHTVQGQIWSDIQDLGIFVLPCLVEQFEQGNYDFLLIFGELTNDEAPVKTGKPRGAACVKWWQENKADWQFPPEKEKGV